MSSPYVDSSFVPQVEAEANGALPYDALYSQDGGFLQDSSQFDIGQYVPQRGLEAGGMTGCDRNKPRGRQSAAKRVGACARCRRLKMKCTFTNPSDDICSRCTAGNYECHFPGRKPHSPGMRVVLQQQIREKNAMIDKVLSQVNPGPTMPTPLTLVPARLPLSEEERNKYRDVLAYIERSTTQAAARIGGNGRPKFDISALEDPSEVDSESDNDMEGLTSPERGLSLKGKMRQMDAILEVAAPTGMMAIAALETRNIASKGSVVDSSTSEGGSSHKSAPDGGPATNLELRRLIVERQAAPDILLSGLVTPDDAAALFQIHYQWVNPIIPILDENIHTPATVLARCPFLFTIICTVASRYYDEKPHIHGMAIHFAKAAAANAIIDGWKTVEMCQAFALWSVYNPPARRWEEDRAWCYTGIAFRLATELSLSRIPDGQPPDERQEREILNRTRMWLMCYIMDRCLSIQSGKAWMVQEDVTVRNASQWLQRYKYHNACDSYLTSLTELLCIVSRFVSMVNPAFGTNSAQSIDDIEIDALYKAFDNELLSWKSVIDDRHKGEKAAKDPGVVMQITLINCVYNYCRLVICCCGMQLMTKRPSKKPNELFAGCVQAATTLVKLMVEDFAPTGFIRYFPELIYVHAAFAAVVLMKCLRPEFNALLDIQQEERIIELVKKLFEAWVLEKMSTDEKQNTQLYARFLKQLMDPHIARLDARKSSATQRNGQAHTNGHNPVSSNQSISSISTSLFPGLPRQDPAATLGNLYATGLDATKAAVELAAAGMMPNGDGTWDQFFPPADGSGMNLPDMSVPWSGSMAGGMNADECLAAMMGLGNETWFL
ncbi:uncharacterized protein TRAVEDRAFT_49201 [Trametes versicolor FP-101664 SS1]|uniref:uncharacterized protein n=1 Tax=Trametes versicolor (strain FP-101664) TaxID=717944 RepID=UPI00046236FA|nr:uncharacterized protein TRAVEDRAFT_49201 [Trametes versicolor FP-101664 SS1]EIW56374.1 hypothetical protein TRAVEDRAFT_49201 [Trametes versicolor FP-101664 SS1]